MHLREELCSRRQTWNAWSSSSSRTYHDRAVLLRAELQLILCSPMTHESFGDKKGHYSIQGEKLDGYKVNHGHVQQDEQVQTVSDDVLLPSRILIIWASKLHRLFSLRLRLAARILDSSVQSESRYCRTPHNSLPAYIKRTDSITHKVGPM